MLVILCLHQNIWNVPVVGMRPGFITLLVTVDFFEISLRANSIDVITLHCINNIIILISDFNVVRAGRYSRRIVLYPYSIWARNTFHDMKIIMKKHEKNHETI